MTIKKQALKSKPVCKVTFRVPKSRAKGAETIRLVGDFNNWDTDAEPMKKLKSGDFKVTLDLDTGQTYAFRYLIDGDTWMNDKDADRLEDTPYPDTKNSVIVT